MYNKLFRWIAVLSICIVVLMTILYTTRLNADAGLRMSFFLNKSVKSVDAEGNTVIVKPLAFDYSILCADGTVLLSYDSQVMHAVDIPNDDEEQTTEPVATSAPMSTPESEPGTEENAVPSPTPTEKPKQRITYGEESYVQDKDMRAAFAQFLDTRLSGQAFMISPTIRNSLLNMQNYDTVSGKSTILSTRRVVDTSFLSKMQVSAYKHLSQNGVPGAAIIMNYETGAIVAAASYPSLGANFDTITAEEQEKLNNSEILMRAFNGSYVPGSTQKLITAIAATEVMSQEELEETFKCEGRYYLNGNSSQKISDTQTHGNVNFYSAIAKSCNCYFAHLTEKVGYKKLFEVAKRMGYTILPSADADTGELGYKEGSVGYDIMYNLEDIKIRRPYIIDLHSSNPVGHAWTFIGEGSVVTTPLFVLRVTAAIANDGILMQPYYIEQVYTQNDEGENVFTLYSRNNIPIEKKSIRLIEEEGAKCLAEAMSGTVEDGGTAHRIDVPGYTVCAKTGTGGKGAGRRVWCTAFIDDPSMPYAITVVKEAGSGGGAVCAPIISKLLNELIALKKPA